MRSKFLHFYLCYFSNVMATNFWSIVLTRSSITRHLKFITKRVVSIFNKVAFFVTICPISAIICHKKHLVTMISAILTKINKIFKKKSYFKNFEIIQVLLIFGKSEQRKSDKKIVTNPTKKV